MKEQYQRFCEVLSAKDGYFVNCDKCPIKTECFTSIENMTLEEAEKQEGCEAILFEYILTGEKPS